jgi:hypothetical protein
MLSVKDKLRCFIVKCMAIDRSLIDYSRINIEDLSDEDIVELIHLYKKELLNRCRGDMDLIHSLSRVYVYDYVKKDKYTDKEYVYDSFEKNGYKLYYLELYLYNSMLRDYAIINNIKYKELKDIELHIYKVHIEKIYN